LYSAITCFSGSTTGWAEGREGRIVPLDMGMTSSNLDRPTHRPVREGPST
jgi:hypothetical protein